MCRSMCAIPGEQVDNSPKRDLNPEPSPLPLTELALQRCELREGLDTDTPTPHGRTLPL